MALTITSRGTGTHNTGATSFTLKAATSPAAGSTLVLCISADNSSSAGTTNDFTTVTDPFGNTWTKRQSPVFDNGTASAGIQGAIFTTHQNIGTIVGGGAGTDITVNFGSSPVAKTWTLTEVSAAAGSYAAFRTGGDKAAGATGTVLAMGASATVNIGEVIVAAFFMEAGTTQSVTTPDADATNGTWTTNQYAEIGTTTSGTCVISQAKLQTTANSTQSYDVTVGISSDYHGSYIILLETLRPAFEDDAYRPKPWPLPQTMRVSRPLRDLADDNYFLYVPPTPTYDSDGYPTNLEAVNAITGGFGTWSRGWLFNETVGNTSTGEFGGEVLTLTGTGGTVTYGAAGFVSGSDLGVNFASGAAQSLAIASTLVGQDTVVLAVLYISSATTSTSADVVALTNIALPGVHWRVYVNGTTDTVNIVFGQSPVGFSVTATCPAIYDEWVVLVGTYERGASTNGTAGIALQGLTSQWDTTASGTPPTGSFSGTLTVGDSLNASVAADMTIAALYVGAGTGIAANVIANITTIASDVYTALAPVAYVGYPPSASTMAAAFGGTWTAGAGYPFTDASGDVVAQFGSPPFDNTSAGTPLYQEVGYLDPASALEFDPSGGSFNAGASGTDGTSFDVTGTDDLIVVAVVRVLAGGFVQVFKFDGGFTGWSFKVGRDLGPGSGYYIGVGGLVSGVAEEASEDLLPDTDGWVLVAGVIDRSTGKTRIAAISGGVTYISTEVTISATTLANSTPAAIDGQSSQIDHLWIVEGSGVATGLSAGLQAAIESLYAIIVTEAPSIVTDDTTYTTVESITATWTNANSASDRIVLALNGADADDFVDWVYTDGTQVLPGAVVASGFYVFSAVGAATYVARVLSGLPGPTWAVDATSGIGVPVDATEWADVLADVGIGSGGPSHLYLLQEASGNAADSIGALNLTATSITTYQEAVTGWTRDAATTEPESGGRMFESTSTSFPDKSTTSQMMLIYYFRASALTGEWNVGSLGHVNVASLLEARMTASEFLKVLAGNTTSITGSVDYGVDVVIPIIIQHDVTNGVQRLMTHQEVLMPAFTALSTGKGLILGAGGVNCAPGGYLYAVEFEGAAAELDRTELNDLLVGLGWTVTTYPNNPINIRKTGGVNGTYDASAYTSTSFAGDVEITTTILSTAYAYCVGLSADNPDANYTGIDFSLFNDNGTMWSGENGSLTNRGTVAAGDIIKIERVFSTGAVKGYKNGSLVFTYTGTSTAALIGDTSLRFTGDVVANVKITVAGVLQNITWTTTGVTVY